MRMLLLSVLVALCGACASSATLRAEDARMQACEALETPAEQADCFQKLADERYWRTQTGLSWLLGAIDAVVNPGQDDIPDVPPPPAP